MLEQCGLLFVRDAEVLGDVLHYDGVLVWFGGFWELEHVILRKTFIMIEHGFHGWHGCARIKIICEYPYDPCHPYSIPQRI